MTTFESDWIL